MNIYVGFDVAVEASSACALDERGQRIREARVASTPEGFARFLRALPRPPTAIGLEAGPLSQWLHAGLEAAGFAAVLMETRQVKDAFKSRPVKTDRNDARAIAQLMRVGWYRPVHRKSQGAQETRALLAGRACLREKRHDVEMTLRGLLRNFGLKVGKTTARTFAARVNELVAGDAALGTIAEGLLKARSVLAEECAKLDRLLAARARADARVRRLMTAPGVGTLVALAYMSAIDDPARIAKSRDVGPYFGLTPKRYQSGETDRDGRISKCGDATVRALLFEAAHVVLTRPVKGGALKSWGVKLARRIGLRRATVATARKLATILHRMLRDETDFDFTKGAAATA